MEITVDIRECATTTELVSQSCYLKRLVRVGKRCHLFFLIDILAGLPLYFFVVTIVPLFLILETVHFIGLDQFSRVVWLQTLHQLISTRNWFMEAAPDWMRLIHEWVFIWNLHSLNDILASYYVLICRCQLKHFIWKLLLCGLIFHQITDMLVIFQKLIEHLSISSDIVDIRRELRFLFIQEIECLASCIPKIV